MTKSKPNTGIYSKESIKEIIEDMPNTQSKIGDWRERFDEEFVYSDKADEAGEPVRKSWRPMFQIPDYETDEIKSFIEQAIKAEREYLIGIIEGMKKMGGEFGFCEHCKLHKGDYEHDYGTCASYDKALSDLKNKLQ